MSLRTTVRLRAERMGQLKFSPHEALDVLTTEGCDTADRWVRRCRSLRAALGRRHAAERLAEPLSVTGQPMRAVAGTVFPPALANLQEADQILGVPVDQLRGDSPAGNVRRRAGGMGSAGALRVARLRVTGPA